MFKSHYRKHILIFQRPGGTSRGVLTEKESWFLFIRHGEKTGIGECSVIRGLSPDPMEHYEAKLESVCNRISDAGEESEITSLIGELDNFPSIQFGIETALADLQSGGERLLFPSEFTEGKASIPINGLIWMGNTDFMKKQIRDKLEKGFDCLKLKIGALDFDKEVAIIKEIRKEYDRHRLMIRVDANGAFSRSDCLSKLEQLARLEIHSIEQPIAAGKTEEMARLCAITPLPIALDEELIGIQAEKDKEALLAVIQPQYIILKPSLLGGLSKSEQWIRYAEATNAGWWITSALESNIGLNAISQWTYTLNSPLHQGLGTGQLYTNNIPSPLQVESGILKYNTALPWDLSLLYA